MGTGVQSGISEYTRVETVNKARRGRGMGCRANGDYGNIIDGDHGRNCSLGASPKSNTV